MNMYKSCKISNFREDIPGIFNEAFILKNQLHRFQLALNSDIIVPPYEVLIHPSGICNLKCQWCIGANIPTNSKSANNNLKRLPTKLNDPKNMEKMLNNLLSYKKTIELIENGKKVNKEFRIERIQFSGIVGDPLTAKSSIKRAVEILSHTDVAVGVFTNATLITDDIIDDLLKLSYINISLDAGTPQTYAKMKYGNRVEGQKLFSKLTENIQKLVRARNCSQNSNLKINASYVLYPDNYKDILTAAKMLKNIGIDTLRMKQDNSGNHLLSQTEIREANLLIREVERLKDSKFDFVKIHILNDPSEMLRTHKECLITNLMAAIGCDGKVYPCNYHPRVGGLNYGDAIQENFQEIWEGHRRKKMQKLLPTACPAVCDPFKNRANRLFSEIKSFQNKEGINETNRLIQKLVNAIKD